MFLQVHLWRLNVFSALLRLDSNDVNDNGRPQDFLKDVDNGNYDDDENDNEDDRFSLEHRIRALH